MINKIEQLFYILIIQFNNKKVNHQIKTNWISLKELSEWIKSICKTTRIKTSILDPKIIMRHQLELSLRLQMHTCLIKVPIVLKIERHQRYRPSLQCIIRGRVDWQLQSLLHQIVTAEGFPPRVSSGQIFWRMKMSLQMSSGL